MENVLIDYDPINVRWLGYHSALKKFFEDTAALPNRPKNEENVGKNVKVIYSTPSSAFAKYVIPTVNGLTQLPILNFHLSSEENIDEVSGNAITKYRHYNIDNEGNLTQISFNRPLMKSLNYSCNIYSTTMSECDYILTLLECNCNKYRPFSTRVNGRPAQFYIDNVETGTPIEYEGKKIISSTFSVNVPRAIIMPTDIETDSGIIKRIVLDLLGGEDVSVIPNDKGAEIKTRLAEDIEEYLRLYKNDVSDEGTEALINLLNKIKEESEE